jgi:hypothetical protein
MVIGHAAFERQLHLREFGPQAAPGQVGQLGGILFPR